MCGKEGLKLQGNWKGREKGLKEEYLRGRKGFGEGGEIVKYQKRC